MFYKKQATSNTTKGSYNYIMKAKKADKKRPLASTDRQ